ncbi:alkaline phosphatase [Gammaproteobacteria bacterium]|nr:alkaline phosphatase [Gammaproteobacteria bacterium]MDA9762580.1 alkaline phosphatase [Gammaproteobacteria bacterium]MDC3398293.1 alkaline phosphatase [Gammaproteobacteria bacterium]
MKKYLLLFSVAILSSCQDGTVVEESVLIGAETNVAETLEQNLNLKAKNIILFIGDGMGPNQVALARFSVGGANHRLSFENFPVTGIVLNHSAENLYTDSAASATTWAAGVKTKNGYLSVDSDNKFLPTIPELLSTKGYLTGLVATSSITHATPAAFYAHINSRSKHKKIAEMLVESDIAIALGGGSEFFKRPLSNEAIHIINNEDSLDEDNLIEYSRVLGLFGEDGLDRRLSPPTQLKMTETALDFLDSKTLNCPGFFLMSEGSQIDWAGHDNNVKYMLAEFADFDDSIAAAIEFAKQDKETLILVTADHATGGLVLQKPRGSSIRAQWTTTSHDLSSINIYAYGPGAEKFSGVMDNTEIFDRMLQALDYENLDSNNCVD